MRHAYLALLLAGCMSAPNLQEMTAEQITAAAKMKDGTVSCNSVVGPWGRAFSVLASVDRGVLVNGSMTVDGECKVTFSNAPAAR